MRALVQQLDQLAVDLVDFATPVFDAHWPGSRRLIPVHAGLFQHSHARGHAPPRAASDVAARSISCTSAEPTTAASANPPSTETCPGSEMPKPTAIGSEVTRRTRRTSAGKSSGSDSFVPVTPVREITYRNPLETSAMRARRSSGEVGAARKIVSRPCARTMRAVVARFLRREIGDQHAIGAGRRRALRESLEAHLQHGIVIAEKHQRHVALPRGSHAARSSTPASVVPARKRAFARALNHRAVRDRIAEGHAQLDHVRAGLGQREHQRFASPRARDRPP